jgi:thiamine biosynthesis lipoprotein ApbE
MFRQGCHPSGRPWQVAVVQPPSLTELKNRLQRAKSDGQRGPVYTLSAYESGASLKKYVAVFDISDGDAITTSGDSEKVVEREGKIYSHIINPGTGRMLELNDSTLALAVVICKSCMVADALSTVRSMNNTLCRPFFYNVHPFFSFE